MAVELIFPLGSFCIVIVPLFVTTIEALFIPSFLCPIAVLPKVFEPVIVFPASTVTLEDTNSTLSYALPLSSVTFWST